VTFPPMLMTTSMEINSNAIIADASALVSLVDLNDMNHNRAVEEAQKLDTANRPIIVPSEALTETINILGKKFGHDLAREAAQSFLHPDSQYLVIPTELTQLHAAFAHFSQVKGSVSFTDTIVMAVADEYCTKDVFGFDKQFADAGYTRLDPAQTGKEAA
jgi:predicted nucleic acid-binding protein